MDVKEISPFVSALALRSTLRFYEQSTSLHSKITSEISTSRFLTGDESTKRLLADRFDVIH